MSPSTPRLRILLSAFACDPEFGSDEEVGWQWARQLSQRGYGVTVLTRASHRPAIERAVRASGDCAQVQFVYVDLDRLHRLLFPLNRRNHLYYYIWQVHALLVARRLLRRQDVDVVHHVTWVSFRQPSLMGLLGRPFIFGPVAGGDEIPPGYTAGFSPRQRLLEGARAVVNRLVRIDPLMWLTYSRAQRVYFTSQAHLRRVSASVRRKAGIELAIGCDLPQPTAPALPAPVAATPRRAGMPPRLLFVGRCIALKGLDIGLQALPHVLAREPQATLTIVGDGTERARWTALAATLGVGHALRWLGWKTKDEVQRMYPEYDLLFNPSLRDSGGFVVLEALQQGVPVVCFRLGGPGQVVEASCGEVVDPPPGIQAAGAQLGAATLRLIERTRTEPDLPARCRERAADFTWDALVSRIYAGLTPST